MRCIKCVWLFLFSQLSVELAVVFMRNRLLDGIRLMLFNSEVVSD